MSGKLDLLAFAVTLFLVLDPFGNSPVFNAVLAKIPEHRRRAVLVRELFIALGILLAFLFLGKYVLGFLRVGIHTLSISGGIVLFLIALGMVFPARSMLAETDDAEPFIVPLAVPLMVGPSCIALLLLTASRHPRELVTIAGGVGCAWLVSSIILLFSPVILRVLGTRGARAMERLMGLLLILVAVQMFLDGVTTYGGFKVP